MSAALEVVDLVKRFGPVTAVNDVGFALEAGSVTGFIGPNGAGKTTTLRMCATLELPDEGEVRVFGNSALEDPRAARRLIGFMPDSYGAYTSTTAREYLDFYARAYGLEGARRRSALETVIDFTGLGPLTEREIHGFSKGMKQRLCLAKTLLHDPAVLLLDEPTAGLDPRARIEFRELVGALAGMGKALLVSSHILSELTELCDAVVILESGRMRAHGRIESVLARLQGARRVRVRALGDGRALLEHLAVQPGVDSVAGEPGGASFDFTGEDGELADLLAGLITAGLRPVELVRESLGLEEMFLRLTAGEVA